MSNTKIKSTHARRVWDSRGRPTVEVEITLNYNARGRAIPVERDGVKTGDWVIPKTSDRVTALNFLAERGFVKPPTTISLDTGDAKPPIDFGRLDDKQLDQYERLLAIAAGEAPVIDVVD